MVNIYREPTQRNSGRSTNLVAIPYLTNEEIDGITTLPQARTLLRQLNHENEQLKNKIDDLMDPAPMQLDNFQKSKIRFHLGYNSGAQMPAGDRARLEEAMSNIPDENWFNEIVYQLKRCEIAWKVSSFIPDDYFETDGDRNFNFSRLEQIRGDVARVMSTSDPLKADADFREVYLREVDRLAETLYVANYRRPEVRRYAFERSGSEFIMAIPGPADTAVGSRIALAQTWR